MARSRKRCWGLQVPVERVFEVRDLDAQAPAGLLGQHGHILLAGEERLQHRARALAQHVGRHCC
ncbi:MAG TPA: hypothetical protein VGS80_04270 [Ktedonobacterales bacterium]|nr:hypothetical protein [Ktedonobacterales bacterium]